MKVRIFCNSCNRWYEEDISFEEENPEEAPSLVPSPKKTSRGIKIVSLVHDDHILVAHVDLNGDVRNEQIIERIGVELEKFITSISIQILSHLDQSLSISILSDSQTIHRIVLGIYQQILLNIGIDQKATLEISSNNKIIKINDFSFHIGSKPSTIQVLGKNVLIVHVTSKNVNQTLDLLDQIGKETNLAVLFGPKVVDDPNWNQLINRLLNEFKGVSIVDAEGPLRAVISIANILEKI